MGGQMVEFKSNGGTCKGYLAIPQLGKGPGVVVLQEWWGLVDHIKDVCDRLAREGFVALAPDLYHGETAKSPDAAGKLMMALNIAETEKDMAGAIKYLLGRPEVTSKTVGTVGFCMGGQLSLYAACANPQVGACIIYYGIHPKVEPDIKSLKAPVLGFFAENDTFVKAEAVHKLEKQLKDAGKSVEFTIYPQTNHGFFNDTRPENYHDSSAKDTFNRMVNFFRKNVR